MASISEAFRDWLLQPVLEHINQKEKHTMSALDDLQKNLDDAVTKLGTDQQTEFDALKAQIAAGGVTQEQLDALQATIDRVKGLDAAALAVVNPVAPTPPPAA